MSAIEQEVDTLQCGLNGIWQLASERLWSILMCELLSMVSDDSAKDSHGFVNRQTVIDQAERISGSEDVGVKDNHLAALSILLDSFNYRHNACVCQVGGFYHCWLGKVGPVSIKY